MNLNLLPKRFRVICKICGGKGNRIEGSVCSYCQGRGWHPDRHKLDEIVDWAVVQKQRGLFSEELCKLLEKRIRGLEEEVDVNLTLVYRFIEAVMGESAKKVLDEIDVNDCVEHAKECADAWLKFAEVDVVEVEKEAWSDGVLNSRTKLTRLEERVIALETQIVTLSKRLAEGYYNYE